MTTDWQIHSILEMENSILLWLPTTAPKLWNENLSSYENNLCISFDESQCNFSISFQSKYFEEGELQKISIIFISDYKKIIIDSKCWD